MDIADQSKQLIFPVIWIGSKEVRVSRDMVHFRTCDLGLFKAGYRQKGTVVDSALVCRKVLSSKRIGYAPPFWGFRLGLRHILLDFEWSQESPAVLTLEELKSRLIEAERGSGMYVGMAGSPKAYERSILKLSSYDEIVQRFAMGSAKTGRKKFFGDIYDG